MDGDLRAAAARVVTEEPRKGRGRVPRYVHAEWEQSHPGLVAGITGAGAGADFGLTTTPDAWTLGERVERLAADLGVRSAAMVRQVHGRRVVALEEAPSCGMVLVGEADGMLSGLRDLLLVVTAADCVPVYLLDSDSGRLGLLHAGWRGAAAGVLETGLEAMGRSGSAAERLEVHFGPAICGDCYEVGPEVLRAFGRPAAGPGRLDLRAELSLRAREAGVPEEAITVSSWCTRCGADRFHSHRGNPETAGRMAAYLGWRPEGCP